jgi:RNA polymerase sigma factor (sigma-70 family)
MTSGRYGPALRQIGRLLSGASVASLESSQLLERFAKTRDEAAFEALIHQHGPMVLGTCRRMLADPHDVEDAFQATFLVLARRASSIQDADRLGPWLHRVARRVASRSRALSARRNSLRRDLEAEPAAEDPGTLEAFELRAALDEELAHLPEKYRAPLVLCYLEGLTHDEAAQKLRWPVGTVRSRLAGGRDRLRERLTRRGLAPASAVPLILARASIPQALLTTTLKIATSAGTIPSHVATLAKGVLVAMIWNKLKLVGALGLMAGLTVGGAGIAGQQSGSGHAPVVVKSMPKPTESPDDLRREKSRILGERLFESEKKEEDLKHQLKLMEIAGYQLEAELGLGVDPEHAQSRLKDLDQSIKDLESELAKMRESLEPLVERARQNRKQSQGVAKPVETDPEHIQPTEKPTPQPKAAPPSITQMVGGWVVSISGERDRVTVLNTETGLRTTHRFPSKMNTLVPVCSSGVIAFYLKAPEIRQVVVFNFGDKKWYTQDLKESTTEASPVVGPQEARYELGRFLYIFSARANKWSILELKSGKVQNLVRFDDQRTDKRIFQEGTILHIYNPRTGEWTHEDTDKPDAEASKPSVPKDDGPRSAPSGSAGTKPQAPEPVVQTLSADEPTLFAVISAERDRVTMIDSQTQKREILRLPKGVKEVTLLDRRRFVGLSLEGQAITRTAFYDRKAGKWFEHELKDSVSRVTTQIMFVPVNDWPALIGLDLIGPELTQLEVFNSVEKKWIAQPLREPVKGSVGASMSREAVIYRVGRDIYIYSTIAKKWAALELKQGYQEIESGENGSAVLPRLADNGKLVVPEADVMHIYDVKTGDWTHIDTKNDK